MEESITITFEAFQKDLEDEHEKRDAIRTIVKELDQAARQMSTVLQMVHKPGGLQKVPQLTEQVQKIIQNEVQELHSKLVATVPSAEFYRYHDQWKFTMQRLVFTVSFIEFLSSQRLLLWQEAAAALFLTTDRSEDKLYLDLEDYLHGLISLSNELSRLAVNSVTSADYAKPLQIASFMGDLESGFRLLNLKNDSLRKRFDSIKYDLKKVEEVVYDISIRGLAAAPVSPDRETAAPVSPDREAAAPVSPDRKAADADS
ncbi:translin-like [Watersipora subatra]|uniref:translin-like n=1 Tax=Watersipora subatra TaxID=2589382 RepID=UPI00355C6270